jgi:hypothetical protein
MSRIVLARTCAITGSVLLGASAGYMLVSPAGWYANVPGVPLTGPFNWHFVIDIALAYLVSAVGLAVAGARANRALAIQAGSWPVLHAAFHVWLWLIHGLPQGLALPTEAVGVVGLGGLAGVAAWAMPWSHDHRSENRPLP